jgi:diguanylate cyclase (GGDEF)-like protein
VDTDPGVFMLPSRPTVRRRPRRRVTAPLTSSRSGPEPSGPSRHLLRWTAIQIAAATFVIVIIARTTPVRASIALPWAGLSPDLAIPAGMAFWLIFGLLGGLRARARPGGSVMTFSMPFIVAGTLLGGPLAGGLLGLFSELELREIRTQPWYGTLANHAMSILAAIAAAIAGDVVQGLVGPLLPVQASFFVVALATALAFVTVNVILVIPTLALKGGIGFAEASRSNDAGFRSTSTGEAILAWLMASTYLTVGWWAPIVCAVLVLIVWKTFDQGEAARHDDLTGLLNIDGFRPCGEAALAAARRGSRASTLVLLDLEKFKDVNDTYLQPAGDEVLRAIGQRLLAAVRATDSVARPHGDEYEVLFDGVGDADLVLQLATRIQKRIREPIRLRQRGVDVAVDVSIGIVVMELDEPRSYDELHELANSRLERAKALGAGIVASGEEDAEALERRQAMGPRRPSDRRRPDSSEPERLVGAEDRPQPGDAV